MKKEIVFTDDEIMSYSEVLENVLDCCDLDDKVYSTVLGLKEKLGNVSKDKLFKKDFDDFYTRFYNAIKGLYENGIMSHTEFKHRTNDICNIKYVIEYQGLRYLKKEITDNIEVIKSEFLCLYNRIIRLHKVCPTFPGSSLMGEVNNLLSEYFLNFSTDEEIAGCC